MERCSVIGLISSISPETSWTPLRKALLTEFNIEIGGGMGPLAGKVWRIGLMGESARQNNVLSVLGALEMLLRRAGRDVKPGAGVTAAIEAYR